MHSALSAIVRPSVHPSVRPTHGCISQKRLSYDHVIFSLTITVSSESPPHCPAAAIWDWRRPLGRPRPPG